MIGLSIACDTNRYPSYTYKKVVRQALSMAYVSETDTRENLN